MGKLQLRNSRLWCQGDNTLIKQITGRVQPLGKVLKQDILSIGRYQFKSSTFKKSRIRETKNLSTDADSRTDTILERLRDLSKKNNNKNI